MILLGVLCFLFIKKKRKPCLEIVNSQYKCAYLSVISVTVVQCIEKMDTFQVLLLMLIV